MRMERSDVVAAVCSGQTYAAVAERAGISLATCWRIVQASHAGGYRRRPRIDAAVRRRIQSQVATVATSLRQIARDHAICHTTVLAVRRSMPILAYRPAAVAAIASGESYTSFSRRSGVPVSSVWNWVHADLARPPVRNKHLADEIKEKIQTAIDSGEYSLRQIAARHGVHTSTVCKIRDTMAIGGHRAQPVRCRNCGQRITTQECLLCAAREYSRSSRPQPSPVCW